MTLSPQSHSSLGTFETCPRQYEAKYILKLECMKFQSTPATEWGNGVHAVQENYLKVRGAAQHTPALGDALMAAIDAAPAHYQTGLKPDAFMPAAAWVADRAKKAGGYLVVEEQFAINHDGTPTSYFISSAKVRAKIDVVVLGKTTAEVFDWKTGKRKDDPAQLDLYALLLFASYPTLQAIRGAYVWLGADGSTAIDKPRQYQRSDVPHLTRALDRRYIPLVEATDAGMFPPKPSGLCNGWCPLETCEHWKPRRK